MEDFQQVLIDRYGLGGALDGWHMDSINAVSSNGQYFVGYSDDNPTGERQAWLVRLDAPWETTAVPESTTATLVLVALAPLAAWRNRRKGGDVRLST